MAVVTLLPILALVPLLTLVILAVAGVTCLGRFPVVVVLMAIGALGVTVFSGQSKARLVVVKFCFLPQILIVAIGTLGTQRSLVHIILAVAGIALQRRVAKFFSAHMALGALHFLVLGPQAEVGWGVVKLALVKLGNCGGAPFVIGVTRAARLRLHLPVKACLAADIDTYILVAVHAQSILRFTVKFHVALLAFIVNLGMGLHQLPGRNDGLNSLPKSRSGQPHASREQSPAQPSKRHGVSIHPHAPNTHALRRYGR